VTEVTTPGKIRVAVVFGGRSPEHAISCVSAGSILAALDPDEYDVLPVGITRAGQWVLTDGDPSSLAIDGRRLPEITERLATEVAQACRALRELDLLKPPGVAEAIDWAGALHALGAQKFDVEKAAATLGAVLKYREDAVRVHAHGLAELIKK